MVNLCLDELSGELVAVKELSYADANITLNMLNKEVEALTGLQHKNIVGLVSALPKPEEKKLLVVMEYLAGGELYQYWKRFPNKQMPEKEVCEIMLQLT